MVSISDGHDVVAAEIEGKLQTLCAVYGKGCIGPIKSQLSEGNKRVFDLYKSVGVKVIDSVEVARFDPLGASFVNINTPEDCRRYDESRRDAAQAAATGGRR
jgi:molybdopterin-guanine dinucleotide biosynthesis protein A